MNYSKYKTDAVNDSCFYRDRSPCNIDLIYTTDMNPVLQRGKTNEATFTGHSLPIFCSLYLSN